jgi:hypothetical protein
MIKVITCAFKLTEWTCLHLRNMPICLAATDLLQCGVHQKSSGRRKSCRMLFLPWTFTALECWCGSYSTIKRPSTVIPLLVPTSCVIRMFAQGLMSIKTTKRTQMRTQKRRKMTRTIKSARSRSQMSSGSAGQESRARDPLSIGLLSSSTRRFRSIASLLRMKSSAKGQVTKITKELSTESIIICLKITIALYAVNNIQIS